MSTRDAEELTKLRACWSFDVGGGDTLGDSIEKELSKLEGPHKPVCAFLLRMWNLTLIGPWQKYHIRQLLVHLVSVQTTCFRSLCTTIHLYIRRYRS
jgi:hypothetical protein